VRGVIVGTTSPGRSCRDGGGLIRSVRRVSLVLFAHSSCSGCGRACVLLDRPAVAIRVRKILNVSPSSGAYAEARDVQSSRRQLRWAALMSRHELQAVVRARPRVPWVRTPRRASRNSGAAGELDDPDAGITSRSTFDAEPTLFA